MVPLSWLLSRLLRRRGTGARARLLSRREHTPHPARLASTNAWCRLKRLAGFAQLLQTCQAAQCCRDGAVHELVHVKVAADRSGARPPSPPQSKQNVSSRHYTRSLRGGGLAGCAQKLQTCHITQCRRDGAAQLVVVKVTANRSANESANKPAAQTERTCGLVLPLNKVVRGGSGGLRTESADLSYYPVSPGWYRSAGCCSGRCGQECARD